MQKVVAFRQDLFEPELFAARFNTPEVIRCVEWKRGTKPVVVSPFKVAVTERTGNPRFHSTHRKTKRRALN